jgi:hypothetical protein
MNLVIWYSFEFILSDFLSGFSFCSHFFSACFFLGAVVSSTSNCLDGDLDLGDEDRCRLCLGPLLWFERDLLDDEGPSLAGDGVLGFSGDDCLDLSGELSWREDSRE